MEWLGSAYQTGTTVLAIGLLVMFGLRAGDRKNLKDQLSEERATKDELRKDRDDAVKERDEERLARAEDAAEFRRKIDACSQELSALGRAVTGEVHWVAVADQVSALAVEMTAVRADLTKLLEKLGSER